MKDRPILFSGAMVRAVLEDRKTQTRRRFGTKGNGNCFIGKNIRGRRRVYNPIFPHDLLAALEECPYGKPGDRLWVKETFQHTTDIAGFSCVRYRADGSALKAWADDNGEGEWVKVEGETTPMMGHHWKPSIFMPRWASRITLEITGVRAERLQDISEDDAWSEGVECEERGSKCSGFRPPSNTSIEPEECPSCIDGAVPLYRRLWESINGNGSWELNPYVWVVSFRRIKP